MDEATFANAQEVADWLKKRGWKASKTATYRHAKMGKLRADNDGTFSKKAVEVYAARHLVRLDSKKKLDAEELSARKQKAETLLREEQRKLIQLRRAVEEGKYILRSNFELELCGRAAVIQNTLKFMIQTRASEWLSAVGADTQRADDLIRLLLDDLDEAVNEFASLRTYCVLFKPAVGAKESHSGG